MSPPALSALLLILRFAALVLGLLPALLLAAEKQLDGEIVVEASRLPSDNFRAPMAISSVSGDDIQHAQPQLGLDEALSRVPGLFMQNRFNFSQDLRVSIRGYGTRARFGIRGIKILIDGIPETLPDGQANIDSIDLASIGSVDVLRGPASSLYGNAAGGVINITSQPPGDKPLRELRLATGADGYNKQQFKLAGRDDDLTFLLSGSNLSIDGYRNHSDAINRQLNARVNYALDKTSELRASLHVTDQPRANDPGGIDAVAVRLDRTLARDNNVLFNAGEDLLQTRLGLAYKKRFKDAELSVHSYGALRTLDSLLPFQNNGAIDLDRLFYGGGISYTQPFSLAEMDIKFTSGFDYDRQDDDRHRRHNLLGVRGGTVVDQDEIVTAQGVYLQTEIGLTDTVLLSLGGRYDDVRFRVNDRVVMGSNPDDSGTTSYYAFSPSIGLSWLLSDAALFYITRSDSFQTPTTTELANPMSAGGLNSNVEPEDSINYEIGLKGNVDNDWSYSVALFHIDVKDSLIPQPQPMGPPIFLNAEESEREGIEIMLAKAIGDHWRGQLAYTYSDFTFGPADAGMSFEDNTIPGIPEQVAHLLFEYDSGHGANTTNGVRAAFETLFVDKIPLNNQNTVYDNAYALMKVRLSWRHRLEHYDDHYLVEPFVSISNLGDREYNANTRINEFGGRYFEPGPGRSVHLGVTLKAL